MTNYASRFESIPAEPDRYVYRIKTTRQSSKTLGSCEVCQEHASEVFYQVEGLTYRTDDLDDCGPGKILICHLNTQNLFGHEACLKSKRR